MFIASHEWLPAATAAAPASLQAAQAQFQHAALYRVLATGRPDAQARAAAADFLRGTLDELRDAPPEVPDAPQDLAGWMQSNLQIVHARYGEYLAARKDGAPRRFFFNRAHALYFLRSVAPTKLVDGAWLHGLLPHAHNPRLASLVRTYVEELGCGAADKNHVLLYRELLARHGLEGLDGLPDPLYRQGLIQLALGWNAAQFLPEIIGFNLGYEQLPLHLLITAYELNELGLDPYYFTLHVTVDNADTGHAWRACAAVLDNLPRLGDDGAFWQRVQAGARLSNAGPGTMEVIRGFDIEEEVLQILLRKAPAGAGAHSDYCRLGGRSVNDWLAVPQDMPAFLAELQRAGWIRRGEPVQNSRFWKLLQGPRAEMFGVFSDYELQVLHDWIRGDASADGRPFSEDPAAPETARRPGFRALQRRAEVAAEAKAEGGLPAGAAMPLDDASCAEGALLDTDLPLLQAKLAQVAAPERQALLVEAMSPALHWTPAGLYATRQFCRGLGT